MAKQGALPKLTPVEFETLGALWDDAPMTVTEILKAVNARRDVPVKRATMQVQLVRLEGKGWISHEANAKNVFLYRPNVKREEAADSIAAEMTNRVFGGSCVALFRSLFRSSEVSPDELARLHALIEEHKAKGAAE